MKLNRRDFLSASIAAAVAVPPFLAGEPAAVSARLEINPDRRIREIPEDYTGLSYETAELADPRYFSPRNLPLAGLVRRLGPKGVLRLGGNTSEFAMWMSNGATEAANAAMAVEAKEKGWKEPPTPVTPEAIRNLAGFLDATGWTLIWGLNLGRGSPEDAADEAACVAKYAGQRLAAFQIGNEPDLYNMNGLRPKNWEFADYLKQWRDYAGAVRRRVPDARFGAPDVAFRTEWITSFAAEAKDQIVLLTGHYYAEGPPTDPRMTLDRLLHPNPHLEADIPKIMKAANEAQLPFRLAEGNSCYEGGKPGVSNTLGSALWGADLMLHLAQAGYVGVNFHGGSRNAVKAGLGGKLPGASLQSGGPQKYPGAFYTPIAGALDVGFAARPLFYGMMLGGQLAGSTLVESKLDAAGSNVTAYAAESAGKLLVAIFNKEIARSAQVTLEIDGKWRRGRAWLLTAATPESISGITLAGAEVGNDGAWKPADEERLSRGENGFSLSLAPCTAALVFLSD